MQERLAARADKAMRRRVPFRLGGAVMSKQLEVKPQQRLEDTAVRRADGVQHTMGDQPLLTDMISNVQIQSMTSSFRRALPLRDARVCKAWRSVGAVAACQRTDTCATNLVRACCGSLVVKGLSGPLCVGDAVRMARLGCN